MICFHDYVMQSPAQAQGFLLEILDFVHRRFPDAVPRLYHGLPSFFYGKRDIINIGAYKDHFAFYVGFDIVHYLEKLSRFSLHQGNYRNFLSSAVSLSRVGRHLQPN